MNGKDGKPFKTREGGVMRLEHLIADIGEEMYCKITENHETDPEEAKQTARLVALSALKYGDLSNQASKDYIFDVEKFTSFEGNTGPYILYTIVRIKSILAKYREQTEENSGIEEKIGLFRKNLTPCLENGLETFLRAHLMRIRFTYLFPRTLRTGFLPTERARTFIFPYLIMIGKFLCFRQKTAL